MHSKFKSKLSLLVVLTLVSTNVFAAKVKQVDIKNKGADLVNGSIIVINDGEKFIHTDTKSITYTTQLSAKCKNNYRISQAILASKPYNIIDEIAEGSSTGHKQYVSVKQNKALSPIHKSFTIPVKKLNADSIAACNQYLDDKIKEGFSRNDVLKTDKNTTIKQSMTFAVQCRHKNNSTPAGKYWGQDTVNVNVYIKCAKSPKKKPQQVGQLSKPFIVSSVHLDSNANSIKTCPAKIKFTGKIKANKSGTVKYRYIGNNGFASPIYTTKFTKASIKELHFNREFGKEETTGMKLAPKSNNDSKDIQQLKSHSGKAYSGWYAIKIISPTNGKKLSDKHYYNIKCP